LGHPAIKRPPIRSICKSKTRNRGNSRSHPVRHDPLGASSYQKTSDSKHLQIKDSEQGHSKLLGRITVIVFNVPSHIFTIFQIFQRSVGPRHWQATTQFIKFEPVPIYLELSFILFAKFLLFLMAILEAKIFTIQNLFYIF
jgi:hypothetical protein